VRAAIEEIFADPFSVKAREAQRVVLDFSQGSNEVRIVVSRGLGFYPGTEYSEMLLTHYICGVMKFGLDNPALAAEERGGAEAGLKAALDVYKKIRNRDSSFSVKELDDAGASDIRGEFSAFVASALERARRERIAER
jgi:hypothetical protein